MANHKSAAKRARQNVKRNELNRARRSKVRTAVKSLMSFIDGGNKEEAVVALRKAESELSRAATKGVMHSKTAARKTSRLAKAVKELATGSKAS